MMKLMSLVILIFSFWFDLASAADSHLNLTQMEHIYANRDSGSLKVYVFKPKTPPKNSSPAVVIFHGGGWKMGEASWTFPLAKYFSENGFVGIAVEYRLSDEKSITPLEAMVDACESISWVRKKAKSLGVQSDKIAAYGWSTGGHLAASAAIFNKSVSGSDCSPNALVLESPAVSLLGDRWARKLLLKREDVRNISPDENVRKGLPPTLILQGDLDTVTPLAGAERFHRKMIEMGNRCELKVYKDYGHLFTPMSMPDNGWPKPDPKVSKDASKQSLEFLDNVFRIVRE